MSRRPWTGHRAETVGNRTSSAVRKLHDGIAVVADTLRCGTRRNTRRSHLHVRHIGAASTHAGGSSSRAAEALTNDALEGEPKVLGEERIDHGIHGRVAVAQPEDDGEHGGVDAITAKRSNYVDREERQPADDE